MKPPRVSRPSSMIVPSWSSRDRTWTAKGTSPDPTAMLRGTWNVTMATPSSSGNRDSDGGSMTAQDDAPPSTSSVNSSTTPPVFRTVTCRLTVSPGATAKVVSERTAVRLMVSRRARLFPPDCVLVDRWAWRASAPLEEEGAAGLQHLVPGWPGRGGHAPGRGGAEGVAATPRLVPARGRGGVLRSDGRRGAEGPRRLGG